MPKRCDEVLKWLCVGGGASGSMQERETVVHASMMIGHRNTPILRSEGKRSEIGERE